MKMIGCLVRFRKHRVMSQDYHRGSYSSPRFLKCLYHTPIVLQPITMGIYLYLTYTRLTYLEVSMGVPPMQPAYLRGVTRLLWWGTETGVWESLDTQRIPTVTWTSEIPRKFVSGSRSNCGYLCLLGYFSDKKHYCLGLTWFIWTICFCKDKWEPLSVFWCV